jgi:uncharacterized protein (TIGR02996 family)
MADMMAIVSKAVFEKAAGKTPTVGTCLRMDRYVSTNKHLERLAGGGTLYLVTVRPPAASGGNEALWLVAVLEDPAFDGEQWSADPSEVPITDISDLEDKLRFESGKGLSAARGALGMSLQTPRALTKEDAKLLDAAAGIAGAAAIDHAVATARVVREGFPAAPEGAGRDGTGNRRELLLATIVADPENEGARQVYADALVAANDPRGEFILLDIALDGPLSIRRREAMARQREALHAAHAKTWWPYKSVHLRTHRGYVTAVAGNLASINAAARLFEVEPVTEVEVRGLRRADDVELLLRAPWLSRVRRLVVRGKIKDEGFAALVASPALANLRALNVTGNKLTADAIASLRDNLASCRTLVLTNNKLGKSGIVGLLKWKHLGELETLYLGNCDLDAAAVGALLDGPPLAKLAKLALAENQLGNGVGDQIQKGRTKLPALRYLDLSKTGIQTAGARVVAEALPPAVKRIDLRRNRIDEKLVQEDPRITA